MSICWGCHLYFRNSFPVLPSVCFSFFSLFGWPVQPEVISALFAKTRTVTWVTAVSSATYTHTHKDTQNKSKQFQWNVKCFPTAFLIVDTNDNVCLVQTSPYRLSLVQTSLALGQTSPGADLPRLHRRGISVCVNEHWNFPNGSSNLHIVRFLF